MKIMCQKVKMRDLDIGDDVFDEDMKIGLVVKKGKTLLHKHPSVTINFHWYNLFKEEQDRTKVFFADELDEEIYRIYWQNKNKKPSRYLKKKKAKP